MPDAFRGRRRPNDPPIPEGAKGLMVELAPEDYARLAEVAEAEGMSVRGYSRQVMAKHLMRVGKKSGRNPGKPG